MSCNHQLATPSRLHSKKKEGYKNVLEADVKKASGHVLGEGRENEGVGVEIWRRNIPFGLDLWLRLRFLRFRRSFVITHNNWSCIL